MKLKISVKKLKNFHENLRRDIKFINEWMCYYYNKKYQKNIRFWKKEESISSVKKHQNQKIKWKAESQEIKIIQNFAENWKTKLQTVTFKDNANTFNFSYIITEKSKSKCQAITSWNKKMTTMSMKLREF
jgi:hypothetical protein